MSCGRGGVHAPSTLKKRGGGECATATVCLTPGHSLYNTNMHNTNSNIMYLYATLFFLQENVACILLKTMLQTQLKIL